MPEGFKQFSENEENLIGTGHERRVYEHPRDKEKVVAVEKNSEQKTVAEAKGMYYLTKIIHLLLPENIPDVHSYQTRPSLSVREKVDLGESHNVLREHVIQDRYLGGLPEDEQSRVLKEHSNIMEDVRTEDLVTKLDELGLRYDYTGVNFGFDKQGNAKYIEPFTAFTVDGKENMYNKEKLLKAINEMPDEQKKFWALKYFDRLNELQEK